MLLVPDRAPLKATLLAHFTNLAHLAKDAELAHFANLRAQPWTRGSVAFGAVGQDDALDDRDDPSIDRQALRASLARAGVPNAATGPLADAIVDREGVLDLGASTPGPDRPLTLFEYAAFRDVLGDELSALLSVDDVVVDRAILPDGAQNHCVHEGGRARIRLLGTNGTTLAGRAHTVVHELLHALVGVVGARGTRYAASYGQPDYGRFLRAESFGEVVDEEALAHLVADAWLLRRTAVTWSRTWPGAIHPAGRDLHADDLAAFARFRLAQGLGLPHEPVRVHRI